jgi:hypothetical protein
VPSPNVCTRAEVILHDQAAEGVALLSNGDGVLVAEGLDILNWRDCPSYTPGAKACLAEARTGQARKREEKLHP